MVTKVIDSKDFSSELEKLKKENINKFKYVVGNSLYGAIPSLVENSPVDTGLYAQSWKVSISEKDAIIGNIAPHSSIIEFGARPFKPPILPLLGWARRVLQRPDFDSDVWALAVGTQKKIERQGMMPRYILSSKIKDIIEMIKVEFRKL